MIGLHGRWILFFFKDWIFYGLFIQDLDSTGGFSRISEFQQGIGRFKRYSKGLAGSGFLGLVVELSDDKVMFSVVDESKIIGKALIIKSKTARLFYAFFSCIYRKAANDLARKTP